MPKTVLITGCSSGLGLGMTKIFLNAGWRVIATARHPDKALELQELKNPLLTILQLDVTERAQLEAIRVIIAETLNNELDCLINNAGFGLSGIFEEMSEKIIRQEFEVNLMGVIWLTQICLPALRKAKGKIINISSTFAFLVLPLQSMYSASKLALEGFSESLYYELEPHGVQVCIVEPGGFRTRFGDNIVIQENVSVADPVYALQSKGIMNFRRKLNKGKTGKAEDLANCVSRLAQSKKMPLRAQVGYDAKLAFWLKRLLPSVVFEFIIRKLARKIFLTQT